jgi:hypothetical protein
MVALRSDYWSFGYWPNSYWQPGYWPNRGVGVGGGGAWELRAATRRDNVLKRLKNDDRDILNIIKHIVRSGMLE